MRGRGRIVVPALLAAALLLGDAIVAGAEPGFASVQLIPRLAAPRGSAPELYGAVSCPSTTTCVAASPGIRGGGGAPSVVVQTGGTWGRPTRLQLPPGAVVSTFTQNAISAISCSDAATCDAVGMYNLPSSGFFPMAAAERAGTWSRATALPVPSGTSLGLAAGLSCPAAGSCLAVGTVDATTAPVFRDLVWTQASGTWGAPALLPLGSIPKKTYVAPTGIWCASPTSCQAVGFASSSTGAATYVWTDTSGTWATPVALTASSGAGSFLATSISCLSATSCVAVGGLLRDVNGKKEVFPATATETAGTWSTATTLALPALSPVVSEGVLSSVSCAPSIACVAVGYYGGAKGLVGGAATWSGGAWSSTGLVATARVGGEPVTVSEPFDVSCPAATACTAVGPALVGARPHRTLEAASLEITPTRPLVAPGPPVGVTASPVRHGALVRWAPPIDDGGTPVTGYVATLKPGGSSCATTGDACRFTGLQDGRRYVVSVTDGNGTGTSAQATAAFVPGAAPSAPAEVAVTFAGPVATVAWRASTSPPGEPVLRYTVTLSGGGSVRTSATKGLRCRFGGLAARRRLRVEVVALDATGPSRPAVTVAVSR